MTKAHKDARAKTSAYLSKPNSWEAAYIRLMDALGITLNGVVYIRPTPYLRQRYTARRAAGMLPRIDQRGHTGG